MANKLQQKAANQAIAVLTEKSDGSFVASIRSPRPHDRPADAFCSGFATGGGRRGAGGVNRLPASDVQEFATRFFAYF
jgi:hypothetical protein